MKLWIDGQCLQTASRMRGIGRYVEEFVRELVQAHPEIDVHISLNGALAQQAIDARALLETIIPTDNIHVWHSVVDGFERHEGFSELRKLSEIALGYHVARISPNFAISSSPFEDDGAVPFVANGLADMPSAGIFYDAIQMRFKDQYLASDKGISFYNRRASFHADYDVNLCISEFAKNELLDLHGIRNGTCIGAGVSAKFAVPSRVGDAPAREKYSLLYVGGFDWRKNIPRVIEAISLLRSPLRDRLVFVVVGDLPLGLGDALTAKWAKACFPAGNLKIVGRVSDSALIQLYQQASAVIQPSLMEGFGLTALEAILCDTPVVASCTGALPEIVIDEKRLFDPENVASIRDSLQALFDDIDAGKEVITPAAKAHVRSFTWTSTVRRALEAMRGAGEKEAYKAPRRTLDELDAEVLARVRELQLPQSIISGCLARAEPNTIKSRRLIVDATATIISNGRSGIQRVVGKICGSMPDVCPTDVETMIAFSDSTQWLAVPGNNVETNAQAVKLQEDIIVFDSADHILMLDSSWTYYHEHMHSLRRARIVGAQITTCLYDLTPLYAPGFASNGIPIAFTHWIKAALQYSAGFVCISQAVADEFIGFLDGIAFPRPLKIAYWPLGADFTENHQVAYQKGRVGNTNRPRFLMVGTIEPRKGHRVALEAFENLWSQGIDVELVIVGRIGWNADLMADRLRSHPEWNKRLVWDADASDVRLKQYYHDADCLIAASFAEGYGLPIAEASYFHKPIIASDISVFREVAAHSSGATFFEPGSAESLSLLVRQFVEGGGAPKVGEPAPRITWRQSAEALKNLVLGDEWYHHYEPKEPDYFDSSFGAENLTMKGALEAEQFLHKLTFEDGPLSAEDQDLVRLVIKVENRSDVVWTSTGLAAGKYGVHLAVRLFSGGGRLINEGPKTSIPIAILPGGSVYLPIEVPRTWQKKNKAFMHFEMMQMGGAWWGDPIILPTSVLSGEQ